MKIRFLFVLIGGLFHGLVYCFCPGSFLHGQDNAEIMEELKTQGIAVENIFKENQTIMIKVNYKEGEEFNREKMNRDVRVGFSILSKHYPNAVGLRIEVYRNGLFLFPFEGKAQGMKEYLEEEEEEEEEEAEAEDPDFGEDEDDTNRRRDDINRTSDGKRGEQEEADTVGIIHSARSTADYRRLLGLMAILSADLALAIAIILVRNRRRD